MKYTVAFILTICVLIGCGQQEQLKAKIFERRDIKGNRLVIRYRYTVDDKVYIDSATVRNIVINSDSITVVIDPSNPGKSIPDIKN
ncbi:DUF3592 domain-containing protein [Segetibacter aerophilus]|uniref:DUF3592 domain-containing protein n=1 Tax=Segetibacter aerophilus TaxID=670293 RepID=A0A512BBY6_9BACT|nr:hypothetical protein [Segetibacter aerophilus]GEO09452.1 hypothetical protein SAE01_19480 [Segetibacter aerophilus]